MEVTTENLARWIDELAGDIEILRKKVNNAGGGDAVTITPALESGTKVADYSIGETTGSLYAPTIPDIESGEEVLIGNDGTDNIYGKKVHISALPSSGGIEYYPHNIDMTALVRADVYLNDSGTIHSNSMIGMANNNFSATYTIDSWVTTTNICIFVGTDRSSWSADAYLYYKKTPPVETKKTKARKER